MNQTTLESLPQLAQDEIKELTTLMEVINYGLRIRQTLYEVCFLQNETPVGIIFYVYYQGEHLPLFIDHRAEKISRSISEYSPEDLFAKPNTEWENYPDVPNTENVTAPYIPIAQAIHLIEGLQE